MLDKIVNWAKQEQDIRALVLVGSRAEEGKSDRYSDYDLSVYCRDDEVFRSNDQWLTELAPVWVVVPEVISYFGRVVHTRLVIFEPGIKVDFSFYSIHDEPDPPFKVLLDKDQLMDSIPRAPTKEKVQFLNEEFWFEAFHVAQYLKRGDLAKAQMRLDGMVSGVLLRFSRWVGSSSPQAGVVSQGELLKVIDRFRYLRNALIDDLGVISSKTSLDEVELFISR